MKVNISELKEISDVGLHSVESNKYIVIKLVAVIGDAPARSDVTYTVIHTGKEGCDRCVVEDRRFKERMIFPNSKYTL